MPSPENPGNCSLFFSSTFENSNHINKKTILNKQFQRQKLTVCDGLGVSVGFHEGNIVHYDFAGAVFLRHADFHKTVSEIGGFQAPPLGKHGGLLGGHGFGRIDGIELLAEIPLGDRRHNRRESLHFLRKRIPGHGTVLDKRCVAVALDAKSKTLRRGIEVMADRGSRKRGHPATSKEKCNKRLNVGKRAKKRQRYHWSAPTPMAARMSSCLTVMVLGLSAPSTETLPDA